MTANALLLVIVQIGVVVQWVAMFVVLIFIFLQTWATPYVEQHLDVLETVLLTVNYIFLFMGLSRNMLGALPDYAPEANGIIPGYAGHIPRARDKYGGAAHGGCALPNHGQHKHMDTGERVGQDITRPDQRERSSRHNVLVKISEEAI